MKPGGGKNKGAQFERDICRSLSLWISNGERQDLFWRSAMSGGRATLGLRKGDVLKSQAGDISSIDMLGHHFLETFLIEVKFYKDLELNALIKYNRGSLVNFWDKTVDDAKSFHKKPILIAKQNYSPIFMGMERGGVKLFEEHTEGTGLLPLGIFPDLGLELYSFDYFCEKLKIR